jgi:hypothetical protein
MSDENRKDESVIGQRVRRRRFETLVTIQVLYLLIYPYVAQERFEIHVAILLPLALMLAALYAASGTGKRLLIGVVLVIPAFVGLGWPGDLHSIPHIVGLGFEAAFYVFGTIVIAMEVFGSREVGRDTLFGGIAVYILMALCWASLYSLLEMLVPGSFSMPPARAANPLWADLLFFSFTALTTTGFGDITPVTTTASSLALLEVTVGVIYIALVISRLVGLYQQRSQ